MSGEQEQRHSAAPDYLTSWFGASAGGSVPPDPYGKDTVSPYDLPPWAQPPPGAQPPGSSVPTADEQARDLDPWPAGEAAQPAADGRNDDMVKWAVVALVVVVGIVVAVALAGSGGTPTPTTEPTTGQPTTEQPTTEEPTTEEPTDGTEEPDGYGDDAELDALWDACEAGDGVACDELFFESPVGSEYEDFGWTCGNRIPDGTGELCEDVV